MFIRKIPAIVIATLLSLTISTTSYANGVFGASIPIEQPTFCFGENSLGQCVLLFGSAQSCNNTNRCTNSSTPSRRTLAKLISNSVLDVNDKTFCYGLDSLTKQCTLFYGSKKACDSLTPCAMPFKRL